MKHVQLDPVLGCWKFLTSEGEPMGKLLQKCKILLSYVMGPDALRWKSKNVLVNLIEQCRHYLPDTYKLRKLWRV